MKTFKDYLAPITFVIIVWLLILNSITSSDNDTNTNDDIIPWINISLNNWSEWYIVYSSWKKEDISWDIILANSEKVISSSWSMNISLPNWGGNMLLDELWEFKYTNDFKYSLLSWNLWIDPFDNFSIDMKYWTVDISSSSVVSIEQNEIMSNVFVISWSVVVKNLAWVSTVVNWWNKISISRTQWTDEKLDILPLVVEIPQYFKESNWYILNNWDMYLNNASTLNNTSTSTGNILSTSTKLISFDNIEDEDEFNGWTLNIEWKILDSNISRINFWWIDVDIFEDSWTFILNDYELKNKVNDIVYKIYNEDGDILKKDVITLYNYKISDKVESNISVENYSLDSSVFKFVSPKQNPYTTTEELVRIDWSVPVWKVKYITINWYQLKKFPEFWSNWYYFANVGYWNLKEWLNLYKINYYDKDDKLMFNNTFTVIKEKNIVNSTYSDEVNLSN